MGRRYLQYKYASTVDMPLLCTRISFYYTLETMSNVILPVIKCCGISPECILAYYCTLLLDVKCLANFRRTQNLYSISIILTLR